MSKYKENINRKIEEAIKYLSAGEDFDMQAGTRILYNLLDGDLEKGRRGWKKKVKRAYYCFQADEDDFQKGLDLLLQTQGKRLAVYVERQKDHDTIEVK